MISYFKISYHIVSYHMISHHIISYHIMSYYIISCYVILYHVILLYIKIKHHVVSYRIISYYIILCYVTAYHIMLHIHDYGVQLHIQLNMSHSVNMYIYIHNLSAGDLRVQVFPFLTNQINSSDNRIIGDYMFPHRNRIPFIMC